MKHIGRIVRPYVASLAPEYRVVESPAGLRPFAVEVLCPDGSWKWVRGATSEKDGASVIKGLGILSRATAPRTRA